MKHFTVTYDTITEDSAAAGDYAASGFASPGGWKHDDRPDPISLREALSVCGYHGRPARGAFEDCGHWFRAANADQNYRTGEDTILRDPSAQDDHGGELRPRPAHPDGPALSGPAADLT